MHDGIYFNIGQLVSLQGSPGPRTGDHMLDLGILPDTSVAVKEGLVVGLATAEELRDTHRDLQEQDVKGWLVTPGLVDSHTHLLFGGNRANEFEQRISGLTYQQIAAQGGGIRSTVRATSSANDASLVQGAGRYLDFAPNVAGIEAKSGYGGTIEQELRLLRLLHDIEDLPMSRTYLALHVVPEGVDKQDYIKQVIEALPLIHGQGLADSVDVFCEPAYFTPDECHQVLSAAKAFGFQLRLHADQLTNSKGAQLAAELGAKTADHLEQTDEAGISALASSGTIPVLLPASVHCIGAEKYPNARAMIEAGLPVTLATDYNPGSSPCCSLPFVMNLACLKMGMTPAECLTAVTVNAAYAAGLESCCGTIEVGKSANFAIWPHMADYREIPYWIR